MDELTSDKNINQINQQIKNNQNQPGFINFWEKDEQTNDKNINQINKQIKNNNQNQPDFINFWEMDQLMIFGTTQNVKNTQKILTSLIKIVQDLPNLKMPDSIKFHVQQSLSNLNKILANQQNQQQQQQQLELFQIYEFSRVAKYHAEVAFGHPSILSQLNVSFRHKAALYVPFFMPLSIPIFFKFVKELIRFFRRRNAALKFRADYQKIQKTE
eukprot:TRINITY_DN11431_c0_g2_i2.p1 TRINITY_DN11431_c0_g2~~TRINITY_DN11431_c0_g2_i2.p1  ORF type:complete len:214 (+),score=33.30 TRINITY_DN11431_c0_g2_i2:332-973(+)